MKTQTKLQVLIYCENNTHANKNNHIIKKNISNDKTLMPQEAFTNKGCNKEKTCTHYPPHIILS